MRLTSYQETSKNYEKQNWQDFILSSQRLNERLKKEANELVERRAYEANERKNKSKEKQEKLTVIRKETN